MRSRQIIQILRLFRTRNKVLNFVMMGAALGGLYLYQNYFPGGLPGLGSGNDPVVVSSARDLTYTHHAKCRMGCRKIDKGEVLDVVQNGRVNWRKSDRNTKPCPTQAFEKRTDDRQLVRVVLANCPRSKLVVTVIDLEGGSSCNCK